MMSLKNLDKSEEYTTIESMGRIHRYFEVPRRIVCLNYAAAELCAALGIADKITGVASAEESLADCKKEYREDIAKAPFLPAASSEINVPSFRAVCDCKPDIVIGTGYSFNRYGGIADAEEFEEKGIHIYATKATYTLNSSYESIYEDIWNLGRIFRIETRAEELIQGMKEEEKLLTATIHQPDTPIRVFSFDALVADRIITCGQSLENHIIHSAGGINVFGDRAGQFVTVDWQEVCAANPQIILVHCFHSQQDGLQKIAFLKQIPEIAQTEAIKNDQIHLIGIKKVFPAIDNLETAKHLVGIFHITTD
jgi:iron complex transport system substrate-binding protein